MRRLLTEITAICVVDQGLDSDSGSIQNGLQFYRNKIAAARHVLNTLQQQLEVADS